MYSRTSSIPVDRTTKIGCPFGHPIFVFPEFRQELKVGASLREQNALPHEAWTTVDPLAKDDVNNVGAGRAAKGATPTTSTKLNLN